MEDRKVVKEYIKKCIEKIYDLYNVKPEFYTEYKRDEVCITIYDEDRVELYFKDKKCTVLISSSIIGNLHYTCVYVRNSRGECDILDSWCNKENISLRTIVENLSKDVLEYGYNIKTDLVEKNMVPYFNISSYRSELILNFINEVLIDGRPLKGTEYVSVDVVEINENGVVIVFNRMNASEKISKTMFVRIVKDKYSKDNNLFMVEASLMEPYLIITDLSNFPLPHSTTHMSYLFKLDCYSTIIKNLKDMGTFLIINDDEAIQYLDNIFMKQCGSNGNDLWNQIDNSSGIYANSIKESRRKINELVHNGIPEIINEILEELRPGVKKTIDFSRTTNAGEPAYKVVFYTYLQNESNRITIYYDLIFVDDKLSIKGYMVDNYNNKVEFTREIKSEDNIKTLIIMLFSTLQ